MNNPPISKTRILLILTEYPPRIGGMQTHAAYLADYLFKKGYHIEIVTYQSIDDETSALNAEYDKTTPYQVHRILSRIGYWRNIDLIAQLAKNFEPQLIYASTVFYGFLQKRLNIPVICRSVGNDVLRPWIIYPYEFGSRVLCHPKVEKVINRWFKKANYPEWVETFFWKKRFSLMKESAQQVSKIFANSEFTSNLLTDLDIPKKNIDIVVGGVDASRFTLPTEPIEELRVQKNLPQDAFILMTACRLVKKKGIDFLLKTFRRIKIQIPEAHLVIVGDGKMRRYYEKVTKSLHIQSSVTFTGVIPHPEVHQYFWCSDIFVLASKIQNNPITKVKDAETMGRVLCEANAAGIPVIASNSGGIPSVIQHEKNGLLFEEENIEDLKSQVLKLYHDKDLQNRIIQNGKQQAQKKFDWSHIMKIHELEIQYYLKKYYQEKSVPIQDSNIA